MIFIHLLLGILLGKIYGNMLFFLLGSFFPDFDHLYIIVKNKIFNLKMIISSIRYEEKYNIKYKTPLFHSFVGLILFSIVIYPFSNKGATYFMLAYLLHLLIDGIDIDEKYYLYPLKIKFKGILPIWSKFERILTVILLIFIIGLYFL